MTLVFAESSYYVALLLKADQSHARAVEITRQLQAPIITTAWVLTEVANALSAPRLRVEFLRLFDDLQADPDVRIVGPEPETFALGVDLYRNRPDKKWSLTDCISLVVIQRERITEALTSDHDFEQAGFRALLL
jgi:predicted nucleic acid-binding protein